MRSLGDSHHVAPLTSPLPRMPAQVHGPHVREVHATLATASWTGPWPMPSGTRLTAADGISGRSSAGPAGLDSNQPPPHSVSLGLGRAARAAVLSDFMAERRAERE